MTQYLNHFSPSYIEDLLHLYQTNPDSLDPTWRFFFDGMSMGQEKAAAEQAFPLQDLEFEIKVLQLIQGYREMAYLIADVNPLDRTPKSHPLLTLRNFGLSDADLNKQTRLGKLIGLGESATLQQIISKLKEYYCSPVAVETGHIEDPKSRHWVHNLIESNFIQQPLETHYQKRALQKLTEAETFERFLHKRFIGQKRFSLEGNDVLIPMLDYLIEQAALSGANEILIGMAHRGRLNVLANIFQKDLQAMFAEFSGNVHIGEDDGEGDVKYHMGHSTDVTTFSGKEVHLSLSPNPSHLEAVNSVVMGMARSKQKIKHDHEKNQTLVVLLHGDASFAGQGSVYEALNMSELEGYNVGGTIHIIVNNQVGFTTNPEESRSTAHATDIAKMLQVPIFRANADETGPCLRCIELAVQYRNTFNRDVFIDLVGYRRFGHNESDEPGFTQPMMYKKITSHPTVREQYAENLTASGVVSQEEPQTQIDELVAKFDQILSETKKTKVSTKMAAFGQRWAKLENVPFNGNFFQEIKTAVDEKTLKEIGKTITQVPESFHPHHKIKRFLGDRQDMINGKRGIDWGMGEALAFGSLLKENHPIRLAGQDAKRGTFSHRHAVLFDIENGSPYTPLNAFKSEDIDFEVINSLLSEMAAMGFEVGQSWANPNKLTLWEAQFGDFVNGAQIIVDQFICSSAFKWQRYSGLVLLLPHGYEGQGPEHSSARIERFLQACAQNNIQVCNLTTPAQYFHALRRQMHRKFRLPLIIATPKSLLRHPMAVSPLDEFTKGCFQEIIDDDNHDLKKTAKRVILCSGKIYYDLIQMREKTRQNVAIIRVEQFYPFAEEKLLTYLKSYVSLKEVVWCQEEPENMGGWWFMQMHLGPKMDKKIPFTYVGRPEQASPAHGFMHVHHEEQEKIIMQALGNQT